MRSLKKIGFMSTVLVWSWMYVFASVQVEAQGVATERLHAMLKESAGDPVAVGKYVGPGSCSASACHGSISPRNTTKVLQNEYSTWVTEDSHARAYTSLTGSLGRQMSAILKDRAGGKIAALPGVSCNQ